MLQLIRRAALIFCILAAAVLGGASLLPDTFQVSREIIIETTPKVLYDTLADLSTWRSWDPWQAKEARLNVLVDSRTEGKSSGRWLRDGKEDGRIEVVLTEPPKLIDITLNTGREPQRNLSFKLQNLGGKTRLIWTVTGENGLYPLGNIFALQMDKYVGTNYEEALKRLKAHVEKGSQPSGTAP